MNTIIIIMLISIAVVVVAVITLIKYYITTYNYFKSQHQEIEKQRSGIEIALTNRYDTLIKLNKTVNGYTGHESAVLENVTKIRKGMSIEELSNVESEIGKAFSGIAAIAENYPALKASVNFLQLQETICDLENTLQATRRIYNNEVSDYNTAIESFPSCLVAQKSGAKLEPYFEIEEYKKNDVELSF